MTTERLCPLPPSDCVVLAMCSPTASVWRALSPGRSLRTGLTRSAPSCWRRTSSGTGGTPPWRT
eukprot:1393524-Pyramimonas_sp.AAC.3